jgi:hypothetical protein
MPSKAAIAGAKRLESHMLEIERRYLDATELRPQDEGTYRRAKLNEYAEIIDAVVEEELESQAALVGEIVSLLKSLARCYRLALIKLSDDPKYSPLLRQTIAAITKAKALGVKL